MNPDRSDEVRRSITSQYRARLRQRIDAMDVELRNVRVEMRQIAAEFSQRLGALVNRTTLLTGQMTTLLAELRQSDDTTRRLPVLPDEIPPTPGA